MRTVPDMIEYLKQHNEKQVILILDAEKVFDNLKPAFFCLKLWKVWTLVRILFKELLFI